MYDSPREVLDHWLRSVNSGDLDQVLGLYAADAGLLPTFSSHRLEDHGARRDYFSLLASREGLRVDLHERTLKTQDHGQGIHTAYGIYQWRFVVDGELLVFEARFTYTLDLSSSRPILHHHSSQVPRTL